MRVIPIALAAGALLVAGLVVNQDDDYTVDVVLPAATNLVKGSPVQISGGDAGEVKDLEVRDGKAIVTVALDEDYAPLPEGTTARISWKATLGERILDLEPGKESNGQLRDGALIEGTTDRVELDQVLATLDPPTRKRLQSLVGRLATTLDGSEDDANATISAAGPLVKVLGEVLKAVGTDGPAIRSLVSRMNDLTQVLAARDTKISSTVNDLTDTTETLSSHRDALNEALKDLPSTLDTANTTLNKVPGTVDEVVPLLDTLAPGVSKLPEVSRTLNSVLANLQPTVRELRPTLRSLQDLLGTTPALLGSLDSVVPQVETASKSLAPVLSYLRPYTPELAGWLSNWGSAAANYDSNGHYLRAFVQEGTTSLTMNPGVMPPGITSHQNRYPGESEGQRWTDANGSEMR
ncbi:hypothetical protein ASG90_06910 [Nocardioides sp. Soil797]|nr:hypothetical protein ASG90_06910 [Nocardioides sp. Soil797]